MPIDWGQVGLATLVAAKNIVGANWAHVAIPAAEQIKALVAIGEHIEAEHAAGRMTQENYDMLRSMEKNAVEGVLSADKGIGIVIAEQAAAAAWDVVETALGTVAGFAFV